MNKPALLPTGFADLLPEEAEQEAAAITTLMAHFGKFGYRRIKPPMMEFEETLLAPGPGAALAKDTFRVMDSVSHQMMGLRADITPQIARIVCTRLRDEPKPLRLSYANDVLRMRAGQLRSVRQFCQVGCEMVGDEQPESYIELLMVALSGLKTLGISDITLDFAMPRAFDLLCPESLSADERDDFMKILAHRDQSALEAIGTPLSETLLTLLKASGDLNKALPALEELNLPAALSDQIADLKEMAAALAVALAESGIKDVSMTLDPFETKGSGYYKGLAFSLFSTHVRGELGRGGHYSVNFGEAESGLTATGFTLYMDTLCQVLEKAPRDKVLAVLPQTSWVDVQKLHEDGWITIFVKDEAEAKCVADKMYKNGKII